MKIIITGGAGFIGSAVIRQYINVTGHKVINLDALTYAGNLESLTSVQSDPRYQFEHVDIQDRKEVERVFEQHRPDAVMHLCVRCHQRSDSYPSKAVSISIFLISRLTPLGIIGLFKSW